MICPFCKEEIKDGAILCKYCKSNLSEKTESKINLATDVLRKHDKIGIKGMVQILLSILLISSLFLPWVSMDFLSISDPPIKTSGLQIIIEKLTTTKWISFIFKDIRFFLHHLACLFVILIPIQSLLTILIVSFKKNKNKIGIILGVIPLIIFLLSSIYNTINISKEPLDFLLISFKGIGYLVSIILGIILIIVSVLIPGKKKFPMVN